MKEATFTDMKIRENLADLHVGKRVIVDVGGKQVGGTVMIVQSQAQISVGGRRSWFVEMAQGGMICSLCSLTN